MPQHVQIKRPQHAQCRILSDQAGIHQPDAGLDEKSGGLADKQDTGNLRFLHAFQNEGIPFQHRLKEIPLFPDQVVRHDDSIGVSAQSGDFVH